jgi:hypothetical protein
MDETTGTRISIICLGLILMAIGVYLPFIRLSMPESFLYLIPFFGGLGIVRYGYNYKRESKPVRRLKLDLGSEAKKVAFTGLVMFFVGLGFISLGFYSSSGPLIIGAFLFGFVGFILMIVGRIMGLTERENQDVPDSSRSTAF